MAEIDDLFNPDLFDNDSEYYGDKWMRKQAEALAKLPDDPWNHWEPMDDDDPVLDYLPDPYNRIEEGKVDIKIDLDDFE